jgi:hypothetical protein
MATDRCSFIHLLPEGERVRVRVKVKVKVRVLARRTTGMKIQ